MGDIQLQPTNKRNEKLTFNRKHQGFTKDEALLIDDTKSVHLNLIKFCSPTLFDKEPKMLEINVQYVISSI